MQHRLVSALATVALLFAASSARAQGTSEIRGKISDPQSAVLPGVAVTIRNQDTGMFRETITGADGTYFITAVLPGRYDITAELSGFRKLQRTVTLEIGKTVTIDLQLQVGGLEEAVTVTGESPLVDTTSKEIGGNIAERELRDLPVFNRNWIQFVAMMPGVVYETATDTFGADTIQVNGQDSRNNNFLLDGASNMDDLVGARGGTQVRTPLLAIQEFQVVTNQPDAEFGRTTGAVINAVSKSGSNALKYELFGTFQDASLTAESFFVKRDDLDKPDTKQNQWGGNLGGPIVKDKAFFFFNLERIANDRANVVIVPSRPDLNWSPTTVERVWNTLGRVDHQINAAHTWTFRYMREQSPGRRQITGRPTPAATRTEYDVDTAYVGNFNSTFGGTKTNTLRLSATTENVMFANDQFFDAGWKQEGLPPTLAFQNYTDQQSDAASGRHNNTYMIEDTLSWYLPWKGQHALRIGAQYQYGEVVNENQANLNGTFSFGQSNVPFDPANPRTYPDRFSIRIGGPLRYTQIAKYTSIFAQDKWKTNDHLTLNIGVRWDLEQFNVPPRTLVGLNDENSKPPVDWNNISPRVGFAYALGEQQTAVIRGAYGLLYNRSFAELFSNFFTQSRFVDSFVASFPITAADSGPRNGRLPTDPTLVNGPFVTPALLNYINTTYPPGSTQLLRAISVDNPNRHVPFQHQFSIGYERQFGGDFSGSIDYIHSFGRELPVLLDLNQGSRPNTDSTTTVVRPDPNFNAINMPVNEGRTDYDGLNFLVEKRWSNNHSYRVAYTLSYARGNTTGTGLPSSDYQVGQDLHLDLNQGPLSNDRRHNLSAAGTILVPRTHGMLVSWVTRYLSGTPISLTNNLVDTDMNGRTGDLIPAGTYEGTPTAPNDKIYRVEFDGKRGGARGPDYFQVDLRTGWRFKFPDGHWLDVTADVFNVFNRTQFNNPGGNIGATDFLILDSLQSRNLPRALQIQATLRY
jgi:Carboxypeptidase regulatory-like domain